MAKVTLPLAPNFVRVWKDGFASLSLRTGHKYPGYKSGKGTWADAGLSYMNNDKGFVGYGHDWFVRHSYNWQALDPTFPVLGMIDITETGVQLKGSEAYPLVRAAIPKAKDGIHQRLLGSLISTSYSAKIAVPFARRIRGTVSSGNYDFPAWWGLGGLYAGNTTAKHLEIDDMERFGSEYNANTISQGIHWLGGNQGGVVNTGSNKLNVQFETVIIAEATRVRTYINGILTHTMPLLAGWDVNDLHHTVLNQAAGLKWAAFPVNTVGNPVTTIRSVEIFAPRSNVSGIFPPTPPIPRIIWGAGYTGGVLPATTPAGTKVATLTGASSYTLLDYNGSTPCGLTVSGSDVVTTGALPKGAFDFYIRGIAADGTPGIAPRLKVVIRLLS